MSEDGIQERANANAETQKKAAELVERAQREAAEGKDTKH